MKRARRAAKLAGQRVKQSRWLVGLVVILTVCFLMMSWLRRYHGITFEDDLDRSAHGNQTLARSWILENMPLRRALPDIDPLSSITVQLSRAAGPSAVLRAPGTHSSREYIPATPEPWERTYR